MSRYICELQGRCCPHEFYNRIEQAISDSDFGVPCEHLVEVAPVVHGRWVTTLYTTTSKRGRVISNQKFSCSECGYGNGRKRTNYCPNCGARMDGKDGETE